MKWAGFLGAMLISANAFAAPLEFNSGPARTIMIELYTSEGCSSCPPAERYLNGMADNKKLWKRYVPLALHVDYWDYLGWPDRFAKPEHARRQRAYARHHHSATVYTPAFFVNGQSWRPGIFKGLPEPATPNVGNLRIRLDGHKLEARFDKAGNASRRLTVHVAVAGLGLKTRIKAGENAGRFALHDFVLLGQTELKSSAPGHWTGRLPNATGFKASRYALVGWVEDPDSPAPVQAAGGYLPHL